MKAQAQKLEEMERKFERLRMQHEHDKIEHVSAWQVADVDPHILLAQAGLQPDQRHRLVQASLRRRDAKLRYQLRLSAVSAETPKDPHPHHTGQPSAHAEGNSSGLSALWSMSW